MVDERAYAGRFMIPDGGSEYHEVIFGGSEIRATSAYLEDLIDGASSSLNDAVVGASDALNASINGASGVLHAEIVAASNHLAHTWEDNLDNATTELYGAIGTTAANILQKLDGASSVLTASVNGASSALHTEIAGASMALRTKFEDDLTGYYKKTETYTQAEVNAKVAGIVDSAPETLDTLKEIANSLNNDKDFAATMTTELGKKQDKAMTGYSRGTATTPVTSTDTVLTAIAKGEARVYSYFLQRSKAYTVGERVISASMPNYLCLVCATAGTTGTADPSGLANVTAGQTVTDGTATWTVEDMRSKLVVASSPSYYQRQQLMAANKTTVTIYPTWLNINDSGYILPQTTVNLATAGNWDSSTYATAANRAGKDFYVYACEPSVGHVPVIKLSANSTYPTGYTAANSRKIGGFHCLCVAVGTISGHTLTGYAVGNILPQSVWDLMHRPVSDPEGMVWESGIGKWVDIYLPSYSNGKLQSVYDGVVADGESSEKFHGLKFVEEFGKIGKRLLTWDEFMVVAKGSNEGTNIKGTADPNTTGGHVDTASRRMISHGGLEDCCGAYWQWSATVFEHYAVAKNEVSYYDGTNTYMQGYAWDYASIYNSVVDSQKYGNANGLVRRAILGGGWGSGAACGSRGVGCANVASRAGGAFSARGASEPRIA